MPTISINEFLSRVDLKQIAFIESLSSESMSGSVSKEFGKLNSAVSFIGSSTLLTPQSLDYFKALAHGRMLDIGPFDLPKAHAENRLVPLSAILNLELVPDNNDPRDEPASAVETRSCSSAHIVYRAYDPCRPERRYRKKIPSSLIDKLLDRDTDALVDIGNGKFVFANEIEDARPLEAWQIARLAKTHQEDGPDEPPLSILVLRQGEFIASSFAAQTIEGMIGRPLPSARAKKRGHGTSGAQRCKEKQGDHCGNAA